MSTAFLRKVRSLVSTRRTQYCVNGLLAREGNGRNFIARCYSVEPATRRDDPFQVSTGLQQKTGQAAWVLVCLEPGVGGPWVDDRRHLANPELLLSVARK